MKSFAISEPRNRRSAAQEESIRKALLEPHQMACHITARGLEPGHVAETATEIGNSALRLRPAAPIPHQKNLSTLAFILELGRNPIAAFGARAYRELYVYQRSRLRHFLMVAHPEGVKHVLLDNAANYVKSFQAQ